MTDETGRNVVIKDCLFNAETSPGFIHYQSVHSYQ